MRSPELVSNQSMHSRERISRTQTLLLVVFLRHLLPFLPCPVLPTENKKREEERVAEEKEEICAFLYRKARTDIDTEQNEYRLATYFTSSQDRPARVHDGSPRAQ